ncbi:hypothetical protein [Vibrio sp. D431a]|uniref:hypothetical protein n=1 Tax=Vibrio sp. D431a TaxID=2837388 RepID=UPI0025541FB4|nr:hypothetical protein [Vibrio sp. D431a]MDK9789991.1 hypothetical protein [Vibrio sp. D431a]
MTVFSSTADLNAVSKLVSSIYRSNLSTVRHKIAVESGYKNDNAHVNAIKKANLKDSLPKKELLNGDRIPLSLLSKDSNMDWVPPHGIKTYGDAYYNLSCPIGIKLVFDGYEFTDERLLTSLWKISESDEDTDYSDFYTYEQFSIEPCAGDVDDFDVFFFATLCQRIDPYRFIDDLDFLENNPELTKDLIQKGSLPQYNFLTEHPSLIEKLGLQELMAKRYYDYIRLFTYEEIGSLCDFPILHLSSDAVYESTGYALTLLETPKPEWFTPSVWEMIEYYGKDSFEIEILDGFCGAYDGTELAANLPYVVKSQTVEGRNFNYSLEQAAYLRHTQFFVEVAAYNALNGGEFLEGEQSPYTLSLLLSERPLDLSSDIINKFLATTHSFDGRAFPIGVAVTCGQLVVSNSDVADENMYETMHFDMCFLGQLIISQCARLTRMYASAKDEGKKELPRAILKDLFHRLSSKQLETLIDLSAIGLSDEYSLYKEKNARDWLRAALKKMEEIG